MNIQELKGQVPHEEFSLARTPQEIPMRWPFRIMAGCLALGIMAPFAVASLCAQPTEWWALGVFLIGTYQFGALAITGKVWRWHWLLPR